MKTLEEIVFEIVENENAIKGNNLYYKLCDELNSRFQELPSYEVMEKTIEKMIREKKIVRISYHFKNDSPHKNRFIYFRGDAVLD